MRHRNVRQRSSWRLGIWLVSLFVFAASSGCQDAEEFRAATASSFESALTTFATGFIDGLIAVYEPDSTSDSNTST